MRKHGVVTGAQLEHLLQVIQGFTYCPRRWKRPEVAVRLYMRAAIETNLRKCASCDHDVGIALVVAKQHVVARCQRLDEVIFKQQRFGLVVRDGGVDGRDVGHHQRGPRAGVLFDEI